MIMNSGSMNQRFYLNKDVYFSIEVKTTLPVSASVLYLYNKNTKVDIKFSVVSM